MMSVEILTKLNDHQIQAVLDDSRVCLVNAQVGSGKTTVLTAKTLYLHVAKDVPYEDMVVLTFTNKAANEIKERLLYGNGVTEENLPYFGTFHSVALTMLRTVLDVECIGFTHDVAVIDPDEECNLANSLIVANSLTIKYPKKLAKRLEQASHGVYKYSSMKTPDDTQQLYELLQEEKKRQNKMSFDDLITFSTELLYISDFRPRWIIIDEFQDTNNAQMLFIRALTGEETKLFAVGDPNQVIYSWRGSNQKLFRQFKYEYKATELSLPENYRSCATILDAARCFLGENADLTGVRETGSKITVRNHYDAFNEANYIADQIQGLREQGFQYSDIAIFYRFQKQSKTLADVLARKNIPFEISLRKTLKDIPVLNWMINVLSAATNRRDVDNAVVALSHPRYGERLTRASARKMVIQEKENLFSAVSSCDSPALLSRMRNFKYSCQNMRSLEDVYSYFDVDYYINPTSSTFNDDKAYVLKFFDAIDEYIRSAECDLYSGIKDFINSSALYGIDTLSLGQNTNEDSVKLMTLHASKGLEFRKVFIIGVNYGLIPMQTKSQSELDEEGRLFFVGITRAKDYLELSYYTSPDDMRVSPGPSRYISAIPENLLDGELVGSSLADLQAYRREIKASMEQATLFDMIAEESSKQQVRKIKHAKYGIGSVVSETDDVLTAEFDGYGQKAFFKAFSTGDYSLLDE